MKSDLKIRGIEAAIQILTKRWNPVVWMLHVVGNLVSGLRYTINIFPPAVKAISQIFPEYYVLSLSRLLLRVVQIVLGRHLPLPKV
jgi:ubiquitin-protein ligase